MYNLIVSTGLRSEPRGSIDISRVFEYTEDEIKERFQSTAGLDVQLLTSIPALIMEEGSNGEIAGIGTITNVVRRGREYQFNYSLENNVPKLTNAQIYELAEELQIAEFEFSRNHWAIKDIDLFRVLYRNGFHNRSGPSVFQLSNNPVNPRKISFMMPFSGPFTSVYNETKALLEENGYTCHRADDMWLHDHIMADVLELICTSAVVICDLSSKNPNVFYEAGIAHCLGKQVVLITQSHEDVPFDLRSIRYLHYLNNGEGRAKLAADILGRVESLS